MGKGYFTMKKVLALKKLFTSKKVRIGLAIVAVLAMIAIPVLYQRHIQNSRNQAAQDFLQQISLAEIADKPTCCFGDCEYNYIFFAFTFTHGTREADEAAVMKLAKYDFRPDPSIAFNVLPPTSGNGFVAFAAHNSVGSTVYVYDNISGGGVQKARENEKYGGIEANSSLPALFRYQYNPSNTAAPVVQMPNSPQIAPDPRDKDPNRRLVVTVAAE